MTYHGSKSVRGAKIIKSAPFDFNKAMRGEEVIDGLGRTVSDFYVAKSVRNKFDLVGIVEGKFPCLYNHSGVSKGSIRELDLSMSGDFMVFGKNLYKINKFSLREYMILADPWRRSIGYYPHPEIVTYKGDVAAKVEDNGDWESDEMLTITFNSGAKRCYDRNGICKDVDGGNNIGIAELYESPSVNHGQFK